MNVCTLPGGWRTEVRNAAARDLLTLLRQALSTMMNDPGTAPTVVDLKEAAFWTKRYALEDLRDTLFTILLSRPDMESKLLAADMAIADSLFDDAVSILDAYSFAGNPTLFARALLRKAVAHPLTGNGGYVRGVLVLDSARVLLGADPRYRRFIELYPILFSGLTHTQGSVIPKQPERPLLERILPTGIDVWPNYPNPFTNITSFTFKLCEDTHVRLAVYDAMGREVAVVTDTDYNRGVHSTVLRSVDLPSGLYFYRLTTDEGVIQRKMLLMR
jgi:hypothetical protein